MKKEKKQSLSFQLKNPFPKQYCKLRGTDNFYRIRVGNYKVIYQVDSKLNIQEKLVLRHLLKQVIASDQRERGNLHSHSLLWVLGEIFVGSFNEIFFYVIPRKIILYPLRYLFLFSIFKIS